MESSKTWQYVLLGIGAVVGSAAAIYYITAGEYEEYANDDELANDLTELGQLQKDANGMVKFDDFLKIFRLVTKHSKKKISAFKVTNNEKRRKFLKEGNEEEYRECIKKQVQQEEAIYQEVATEVLTALDIEEQEFMMAQNMHAMNPQFQKVMMEMQLGVDDGPPTQPKVDKKTAKEIFIFVEDEKEKTMKGVQGAGGMFGNPNDMEGTINMIVAHSKVGDKLFDKYGIEEEEFAKCIQFYNLIQDPDIQKIMQRSMQNMGPEAMQMLQQMQGGPTGGQMPEGMGF
jgi:hypothetical protein